MLAQETAVRRKLGQERLVDCLSRSRGDQLKFGVFSW
jgi:hypothetical protein